MNPRRRAGAGCTDSTHSVAPRRERGAILIVSLILLVVLTMLGVTGIKTSTIEETMAANLQEGNRAFQAAETGIAVAFANAAAFDLTADYTVPSAAIGLLGTQQTSTTSFEGWSAPPLDSGYSATSFRSAHFRILSTGTAGGNASSTVTAGAYQIAPNL